MENGNLCKFYGERIVVFGTAYKALGCTHAEEINEEKTTEEPFDVQLEYKF